MLAVVFILSMSYKHSEFLSDDLDVILYCHHGRDVI